MTKEELFENIRQHEYDKQNGRDFYEDLALIFNMPSQDALTSRIYGHAWQTGHPGGYLEVYYHFKDLVYVYRGKDVDE